MHLPTRDVSPPLFLIVILILLLFLNVYTYAYLYIYLHLYIDVPSSGVLLTVCCLHVLKSVWLLTQYGTELIPACIYICFYIHCIHYVPLLLFRMNTTALDRGCLWLIYCPCLPLLFMQRRLSLPYRLIDQVLLPTPVSLLSAMTGHLNTKIVFLDCDGVISPFSGPLFSKTHLGRLKRILDESGAKIVLSSSWRVSSFGRTEVTSQLVANGMPTFIDVTPDLPGQSRAQEIMAWVRQHQADLNIVNFVALDDIHLALGAEDKEFFAKHAVVTDSMLGMNDDDVYKALQLLSDANNF